VVADRAGGRRFRRIRSLRGAVSGSFRTSIKLKSRAARAATACGSPGTPFHTSLNKAQITRAPSQSASAANGHNSVSNIAGDKGIRFFTCRQISNGQHASTSSAVPIRHPAIMCQPLWVIVPKRPSSAPHGRSSFQSRRWADQAVMAITKNRFRSPPGYAGGRSEN
jgi:hypothetical protein